MPHSAINFLTLSVLFYSLGMSEPMEKFLDANEAGLEQRFEDGEISKEAYNIAVSGLELAKHTIPGIFIFGEYLTRVFYNLLGGRQRMLCSTNVPK